MALVRRFNWQIGQTHCSSRPPTGYSQPFPSNQPSRTKGDPQPNSRPLLLAINEERRLRVCHNVPRLFSRSASTHLQAGFYKPTGHPTKVPRRPNRRRWSQGGVRRMYPPTNNNRPHLKMVRGLTDDRSHSRQVLQTIRQRLGA